MAEGRRDRFGRDVARMLLVFFTVAAIDVVALSLLTGELRLWFPMWLDPAWNTNPDAWVVYSQSYIAGIAFIPFVVYIVDRDFFGGGPGDPVGHRAWHPGSGGEDRARDLAEHLDVAKRCAIGPAGEIIVVDH